MSWPWEDIKISSWKPESCNQFNLNSIKFALSPFALGLPPPRNHNHSVCVMSVHPWLSLNRKHNWDWLILPLTGYFPAAHISPNLPLPLCTSYNCFWVQYIQLNCPQMETWHSQNFVYLLFNSISKQWNLVDWKEYNAGGSKRGKTQSEEYF